jgi:hypothetical protein
MELECVQLKTFQDCKLIEILSTKKIETPKKNDGQDVNGSLTMAVKQKKVKQLSNKKKRWLSASHRNPSN